jgi:hypothetical protein
MRSESASPGEVRMTPHSRSRTAPLDGRGAIADDVDHAETRDLGAGIDSQYPHGTCDVIERR